MAEWSGPELLAALAEVGDVPPTAQWLPVALSDLCCCVLALGGKRVTRAEVLRSWGLLPEAARSANLEALLRYAVDQPSADATGD